MKNHLEPKLLVLSSLFPSRAQPTAGLFVRERMFRVGKKLPLVIVSPKPWFPGQSLIRLFKPHFRPPVERVDKQEGFMVYQPMFLSIPGVAKFLDGRFMALSIYFLMRRIRRSFNFDVIDAHFAYPDGYAAVLLGRWLNTPVTVTLRGTEIRHINDKWIRPRLIKTIQDADFIFSVSESLRTVALRYGAMPSRTKVVGNAVDTTVFFPLDKDQMRQKLCIPKNARVLITVGGLVERKGFHRVIGVLPELRKNHPEIHYLVVGGASAEGDMVEQLRQLVTKLELSENVHFLGTIGPRELNQVLSAADVFVLSSRNEGWANVILEAMACGLPVVATDVGGNAEIVCDSHLGAIVPFDNPVALKEALDDALTRKWNNNEIITYAKDNNWEKRVNMLIDTFSHLHRESMGTVSTLP